METLLITLAIAITQLQAQVEQLKIEQLNTIQKEITLADLPLALQAVAICESGARHEVKGKVIKSKTGDYGIMQINSKVHKARAESLGYDIYNGNQNMAYALLLYRENGLRDWSASAKCWKPKLALN
jgi:hypothetical protein